MARNIRQAFTVVELLVVIAIIGVLMAILLPSVQYAREMARKANCSAHIRQIGVAAEAFEAAKQVSVPSRSFAPNRNMARPASIDTSVSAASNPNALSFVFPLLPHLEREDLAIGLEPNASGTNVDRAFYSSQRIAQLFCPSDNSDYNAPNRNSYAINGGRQNEPPSNNLPLDWPANGFFDDRLRGTSQTFRIFSSTKGDLVRGDGASNTFAFVENADLMGWNIADNEYDVAVVWFPPSAPAAKQTNALNKLRKVHGDPMSFKNARPLSYHSGGFTTCFCDGSVKFIADSIDYAVYAQLMTSNSREILDPASTNNTVPATFLPVLNANSY